jgi:hypothetical protein
VLPATTAALASDIYSKPAALLIASAIVIIVGGFLTFFGYRRA